MPPCRPPCAGFTLLEMLLVVAIVGILVAVVMPSTEPAIYDQLRATAQIVATDLAYARSLAVTNNSTYRVTFNLDNNQYILKHSGASAALNQLPVSPFSSPGDPVDQHIVNLDRLPHVGPVVRLAAATITGGQSVADIEFGPLGQTTRADTTTIWLTAGSNSDGKYISVDVNPVTGLPHVGAYVASGPPVATTTH